MTVYVDPARHAFRNMIMCHLWADDPEELHEFAARLGLRRSWFQQPPKASWCHYDISKSKRVQAVRLGAIETDQFGPVEYTARQSGNTKMVDMVRKCRERRK